MIRSALAWLFYGFGHGVWWVFDRFTRKGMGWAAYQLYHRLMTLSADIQGDGRGPWAAK